MAGSQCQRTLIVAGRHRIDGRFRNTDDGRQDHDSEQDRCSQHALSASAKKLGYDRHDNDHTEEAIYNRWNTCQQIDRRFDHMIDPSRTETG